MVKIIAPTCAPPFCGRRTCAGTCGGSSYHLLPGWNLIAMGQGWDIKRCLPNSSSPAPASTWAPCPCCSCSGCWWWTASGRCLCCLCRFLLGGIESFVCEKESIYQMANWTFPTGQVWSNNLCRYMSFFLKVSSLTKWLNKFCTAPGASNPQ